MKLWKCTYTWWGTQGAFNVWYGVCIADNAQEALILSEKHSGLINRPVEDWDIIELDTTKKGVCFGTMHSN